MWGEGGVWVRRWCGVRVVCVGNGVDGMWGEGGVCGVRVVCG